MSFYEGLQETAASLLTRFGQVGTVTRSTTTGGGPADPLGGSVSTQDYVARMAVFPMGEDRIDGTNIHAGDFQVIVEAIDIEIDTDDTITCTEGVLKIRQLGKIAPAGITVVYDMVCHG